MTKRLLRLLAAAMLYLPFAVQAETVKLRLCYESAEFQPFFNGTDQVPQKNPGLAIEHLAMPAASAAGFELELYRRPWNRCISDMQNNLADGILPTAWSPDRESWARFPGPERDTAGGIDRAFSNWEVSYSIIVASNSNLDWDGNQFNNLQRGLGAPLGHITNDRLKQMGALQSSNIRPEAAMKMILHERLDGYVLENFVSLSLIRQTGLQAQLKVLPTPLLKAEWYVPVTHQFYAAHSAQVWRFWEALVEQRKIIEPQLKERFGAQTLTAGFARQN